MTGFKGKFPQHGHSNIKPGGGSNPTCCIQKNITITINLNLTQPQTNLLTFNLSLNPNDGHTLSKFHLVLDELAEIHSVGAPPPPLPCLTKFDHSIDF